MLTGVLSDIPGYESSPKIISAHIFTRHRLFTLRKWVTVVFLAPFAYVLKVGDTFSARCMQPLTCVILRRFMYNLMLSLRIIHVRFASYWGFVEYLHDRITNKKDM